MEIVPSLSVISIRCKRIEMQQREQDNNNGVVVYVSK